MDKMLNFIIVTTLALTITLVCGNDNGSPLKDIVGYRQWKPLIKWRQQPYPPSRGYQANALDAESSDYSENAAAQTLQEYDDASESAGRPQDLQAIDSSKSKRSRLRQPLCEVLVNIVYVGNGTDGYQYRPDHYITESCLNSYNTYQNKCMETGLSCTQIRQKIFITRRKVTGDESKSANCWEHVRMEEIDAGCECMWPREHIGDKHSYRGGK